MTGLVLDAAAFLVAAGDGPSGVELNERILRSHCSVPHLFDAEVGNVLRRRVLRGGISAADAWQVLRELPSVVDRRYGHTGLAQLAWSLRGSVTYYDALYVALAVTLGVPLLTADARLARTPDLPCAVEVIAP